MVTGQIDTPELMTVRKANALTGASKSFFYQLMREKKLKKYRIGKAVYVNLSEFKQLASQDQAA